VAIVDPAVRRKFRQDLEEKLELASVNNSGLIVSWELSDSLDRAGLVCQEKAFNAQVVEHVAASLIRLLGVGKRLGLVDRDMSSFTVECYPPQGNQSLFARTYSVD
jgi:hypothetical protein